MEKERKKNAAVFLDRDGTINEEVGYLDRLEKLRLFPESLKAIKMINESGMKAVVVTNQSGVARGYFDENFVAVLHSHIKELLQKSGAYIDAFYYCPHHETEGQGIYLKSCTCRKPQPGMLLRASEDMGIDLKHSYVIGDMMKDVEMAQRVQAKGILVKTGYFKDYNAEEIDQHHIKPIYVADNILDAVRWIMRDRKK